MQLQPENTKSGRYTLSLCTCTSVPQIIKQRVAEACQREQGHGHPQHPWLAPGGRATGAVWRHRPCVPWSTTNHLVVTFGSQAQLPPPSQIALVFRHFTSKNLPDECIPLGHRIGLRNPARVFAQLTAAVHQLSAAFPCKVVTSLLDCHFLSSC